MLDALAIKLLTFPTLGAERVKAEWSSIFGRALGDAEMAWAEKHLGSRKKLRERLIAEGKFNPDGSEVTTEDQPDLDHQAPEQNNAGATEQLP